jgi:biotin carboxyl carrier protein
MSARILSRVRRYRSKIVTLLVLAMLGGAGFGLWRLITVQAAESLPTAQVRKGEFLVTVRCRGELKARTTVQITAPLNVPELRIVWQAPAGSQVAVGDAVVKFDPSSTKQQLQEKEAALRQAEAALNQAEAEGRLQLEQDKIELADATHAVERAKIEVSKAEIVSRLQGEESRVDLGLATQKLAVQQAKLEFNSASAEARVSTLKRQRQKAEDEVELAKARLGRMEVKAPIAGMVNYLQNFSQGWLNAKPFKVGDQVWPGSVLAEIPDLATLEIEGKIEEIDRGQMTVGQDVLVRVDSLPESAFPAKIIQLSPLTEMGWEWPPSRSFRGYARLANIDARLRPGMNGRMDVVLKKLPAALSVPAKALFTVDGKPVVYVPRGAAHEAVAVEVEARNPDEIAIKGLKEGDSVALSQPERRPS